MPFKVDATLINWVATDAELAAAVLQWRESAGAVQSRSAGTTPDSSDGSSDGAGRVVLGIDSEFQRTDTFYPLPGLYQVFDGRKIYLIDPLEIEQWQGFTDLLLDPNVVKVMHACSEDLELFYTHLGVTPVGIFDTQLAQAFLSPTFSISYANLVEQRAGELLDKGATRSNWRQRPLTDQQLQYAAADVLHLPQLYREMRETLEAKGRWHWFVEDMARQGYTPSNPDIHYRGVKGASRLELAALQRLQHLCSWRERQAMSSDVPRSRIVRDEHLLSFAVASSLDTQTIREVLPSSVARRFGVALVEAHGLEAAEPVVALPTSLTQAQGKLVTALREFGKSIAQNLEVAPELLARKREVEHSLRHFLEHGCFDDLHLGWRSELLSAGFNKILGGSDNDPKATNPPSNDQPSNNPSTVGPTHEH